MGIANVLLLAQSRQLNADERPLLGARRTLTDRCLPISIMSTRPLDKLASSRRKAGEGRGFQLLYTCRLRSGPRGLHGFPRNSHRGFKKP